MVQQQKDTNERWRKYVNDTSFPRSSSPALPKGSKAMPAKPKSEPVVAAKATGPQVPKTPPKRFAMPTPKRK